MACISQTISSKSLINKWTTFSPNVDVESLLVVTVIGYNIIKDIHNLKHVDIQKKKAFLNQS